MCHQLLDSILSWPKNLDLSYMCVSSILVVADYSELNKVSFESFTAAQAQNSSSLQLSCLSIEFACMFGDMGTPTSLHG